MSNQVSEETTVEAIQIATLDFLFSPRAQAEAERLAALNFPQDVAETLHTLRREYTPKEAGALLALVRLRQTARAKFPRAGRLFFTQAALEQATAYDVAHYRANKLHALAQPGALLDLGSGIGGDALAMAELRVVHAYERDPLRCALLQANVCAMNLQDRVTVHCADWQELLAGKESTLGGAGGLAEGAGAFLDPPRRAGARRLMRLGQILPSWEPIRALQARVGLVCLKLMPGIDDAEIPPGAGVEFVSHAGVCKEAMLWLGEAVEPLRQAAVHDGSRWHSLTAAGGLPPVGALVAGQVLYEPDPAVIRAGAFEELCAQLQAHLFDAQIAYLVSAEPDVPRVETPFATAFRIIEVHPYSLKQLNVRIQALGIGEVELKKRGVPFEPESLRGRIKLVAGGEQAVVFFTRQGNKRLMVVARRI